MTYYNNFYIRITQRFRFINRIIVWWKAGQVGRVSHPRVVMIGTKYK